MIVSRFLLWARDAAPGDRAEAVTALARAYLHSDLSPDDRWQAEMALTAMLDDSSTLVRLALSETFAHAPGAPRHIVVALAGDASEIAAPVLAHSPRLADGDLVDCAALGDERVQCAIAARRRISPGVSAALAEIATPASLVVLAANLGAEITETSLARMIERHGACAELREALLGRPGLPVEIAQAIATALAAALGAFVTGCGWMSPERTSRLTREATERAAVTLSSRGEGDESVRLVAHLRRAGQLTPALILRAILSRAPGFAEAAFAELAGMPPKRAAAILGGRRGGAFRALYGRAGLPEMLRPCFEVALAAANEAAPGDAVGACLSRPIVERALLACEDLPADEAGRLIALLRRFESEAARDEARRIADGLADRAALAFVLEHAPHVLEGEGDRDGRMAA